MLKYVQKEPRVLGTVEYVLSLSARNAIYRLAMPITRYHHRQNYYHRTWIQEEDIKKQKCTADNACTRTAIHILGNLHDGLLKTLAVRRQPRGLGLDDPVIGRRLYVHPQCQSCIRAINTHREWQDTQGVPRILHRQTSH